MTYSDRMEDGWASLLAEMLHNLSLVSTRLFVPRVHRVGWRNDAGLGRGGRKGPARQVEGSLNRNHVFACDNTRLSKASLRCALSRPSLPHTLTWLKLVHIGHFHQPFNSGSGAGVGACRLISLPFKLHKY